MFFHEIPIFKQSRSRVQCYDAVLMSTQLGTDNCARLEKDLVDFWIRIILKDENHNCIFRAHATVQMRSGPISCHANLKKEKHPGAGHGPSESPISVLLVYANMAIRRACVSYLEMVNFWCAGRLHTKVVIVFDAILFLEILLLTKK